MANLVNIEVHTMSSKRYVVRRYPVHTRRWQQPMPEESETLYVGLRDGVPSIWALVNPDLPDEPKDLICVQTGETFDALYPPLYVGSFTLPESETVYHVFEGP